MRLGIVGHAAEKFDEHTRLLARSAMMKFIEMNEVDLIVSGRSPMGGVDVWAEECAERMGIKTLIFPPLVHTWSGHGGFKDRNLRIAANSNLVLVIVASKYPDGYTGMRFKSCYHCRGRTPWHIKSGGCWTAWRAPDREWRIIE